MIPSQYKKKYNNLRVIRSNGTVDPVNVSRYRRFGSATYNASAHTAFQAKFGSKGINMDISIHTDNGRHTIGASYGNGTIKATLATLCTMTFFGKGSPEHHQLVLQLADHWGLAPQGLQAYADSALGVDCNGFVGNYIWYGFKKTEWTVPMHHAQRGPDTIITTFFPSDKELISRWEDLEPSNCYLLGMVDSSNRIIAGGPGGGVGHIAITDPTPRELRIYGYTVPVQYKWVVESTGGHSPEGIWESSYTCIESNPKAKVFKLQRPEMLPGSKEVRFKIALLR